MHCILCIACLNFGVACTNKMKSVPKKVLYEFLKLRSGQLSASQEPTSDWVAAASSPHSPQVHLQSWLNPGGAEARSVSSMRGRCLCAFQPQAGKAPSHGSFLARPACWRLSQDFKNLLGCSQSIAASQNSTWGLRGLPEGMQLEWKQERGRRLGRLKTKPVAVLT